MNFEHLLKLRVAIARVGEMDNARWWNTNGQLGELGATVLKRNFPRSYRFAAARSVFAVAKARCNEIFDPPGSATLWNLPAELEDEFDSHWERWIEQREEWEPFFGTVASLKQTSDVAELLRRLELVGPEDEETVKRLKRSAESRAVQLSGTFSPDDATLRLLALGFSKGEPGALTVPYARLG